MANECVRFNKHLILPPASIFYDDARLAISIGRATKHNNLKQYNDTSCNPC